MKSEAALDERNKKSTGWKRKDGGKYARTRWRSAKTNEEITNEGEDGGWQRERRRKRRRTRRKKKLWEARKERNMKGTRARFECARQFVAVSGDGGENDGGKAKETWMWRDEIRLETKVWRGWKLKEGTVGDRWAEFGNIFLGEEEFIIKGVWIKIKWKLHVHGRKKLILIQFF